MSTRENRRTKATAYAVLLVSFGAISLLSSRGECEAATKEACIDAHGRGQDLREKGQLTRARQMFVTCAQSSCPSLVQGDCARFVEEVDRLVPTVSFGARDEKATDIPSASVYVDDILVATRLDDGKSYDFDPGKHAIRFSHDGKETTLHVILNQGEKGRTIVATFVDPHAPPPSETPAPTPPAGPKRSSFPLVVAGLGGAALVTGGVLVAVGMNKVPSNCSFSAHDCAAAPGDPSFDNARGAVSLANVGVGVGIAGGTLLVGGLIWYFARPATPPPPQLGMVAPWVGRGSGGLAVTSSF